MSEEDKEIKKEARRKYMREYYKRETYLEWHRQYIYKLRHGLSKDDPIPPFDRNGNAKWAALEEEEKQWKLDNEQPLP